MIGNSSQNLIQAILRTVAYADVFDYPLTLPEIHRYLSGEAASLATVAGLLQAEPSLLALTDGYYALPGRAGLALLRRRRARLAARLWPHAVAYGGRIARLPFVRMVAVTGALARNNVQEGADIDYLIVTEPGRLWVCRAMILLLARYSARRGVTLCPNYLISLRALVFPDQTEYAAHEIAQMIPLSGMRVYEQLREKNQWVRRYLPNADGPPPAAYLPPDREPRSLAQAMLEPLLSVPPLSLLEPWEMSRKIQKLSRQQAASPESAFSTDVCKGHDQAHQTRAAAALAERLRLLEPAP